MKRILLSLFVVTYLVIAVGFAYGIFGLMSINFGMHNDQTFTWYNYFLIVILSLGWPITLLYTFIWG